MARRRSDRADRLTELRELCAGAPIGDLQRLGSRIYAAQFGRFLWPDWYILENPNRAMSVPQGLNVYSYTINNPVDFKDPSTSQDGR